MKLEPPKPLLATSAVFLLLISGASLNAAENPAPVMHNAVLPVTVSIAGPRDMGGNQVIDLRGHPEVNILVRNASDKPMTLTTNGWVALYISAIDGKALPQPIVVRRSSLFLRERESHNSRHRGIYNPGDTLVSRIVLHEYEPGESHVVESSKSGYGGDWVNFPVVSQAGGVFRIQAECSGYKSETHDYRVVGPY